MAYNELASFEVLRDLNPMYLNDKIPPNAQIRGYKKRRALRLPYDADLNVLKKLGVKYEIVGKIK